MDTLREVADSNVLVAQMKAELLELEKDKEDFIKHRENEVLAKIHKLLNSSRLLLDETTSNYLHVHQFYENLKSFSEYLSENHRNLKKIIEKFKENSKNWQDEITLQEEKIIEMKKDIVVDVGILDREKIFIENKKIQLDSDIKELGIQQKNFEKTYENIKTLWKKPQ